MPTKFDKSQKLESRPSNISEGVLCAEFESELKIAPLRQVFKIFTFSSEIQCKIRKNVKKKNCSSQENLQF